MALHAAGGVVGRCCCGTRRGEADRFGRRSEQARCGPHAATHLRLALRDAGGDLETAATVDRPLGRPGDHRHLLPPLPGVRSCGDREGFRPPFAGRSWRDFGETIRNVPQCELRGVQWLRQGDASANFRTTVVVDLASARERLRQAPSAKNRKPKIHETLALAERWSRRLSVGEVSRADLGREHGISCARGAQVLKLLRLHPELRAYAAAYPEMASEYRLRPLLTLSFSEQLSRARVSLRRFADWIAATG